jgi:hypothetical protein
MFELFEPYPKEINEKDALIEFPENFNLITLAILNLLIEPLYILKPSTCNISHF